MAKTAFRIRDAAGIAVRRIIVWVSGAESDLATASPSITAGTGVPATAEAEGSLFLRTDGGSNTTIYQRQGAAWEAVPTAAGADAIADTNTYYTTDTIDGAVDAIGVQIGGLTDTTFGFAEDNVLADNDAIYAALDKLDLKWGDLAATATGEGAALVGVEDAAALLTATTVEAALAEIVKYETVLLADPGTGVAIPVTRSATVPITTAAAETNTLAIPTFLGQRLILVCDVWAVGDRVVTVASAVNVTGNNTLTFGIARDAIELKAIQLAGVLAWEVVWNNGVALSTV